MTTYRVSFEGEEHLDVEADYFEIEEGGVLAFYDSESSGITKERRPSEAYNWWQSVHKVA